MIKIKRALHWVGMEGGLTDTHTPSTLGVWVAFKNSNAHSKCALRVWVATKNKDVRPCTPNAPWQVTNVVQLEIEYMVAFFGARDKPRDSVHNLLELVYHSFRQTNKNRVTVVQTAKN